MGSATWDSVSATKVGAHCNWSSNAIGKQNTYHVNSSWNLSGWYGHDCARKKAGLPLEPSIIPERSWLRSIVKEAVAAIEPPPKLTRKHPLIYIYDLEPLYSQKLLQYRIAGSWCTHRRYREGNRTEFMDVWVYAVDQLFHELLIQSEHRSATLLWNNIDLRGDLKLKSCINIISLMIKPRGQYSCLHHYLQDV